MKMLPLKVAKQAEILAGTRNLSSAREAFKPLSKSLMADHNITGPYVEVYCPMVKASWIQKDKKINNPTSEVRCAAAERSSRSEAHRNPIAS